MPRKKNSDKHQQIRNNIYRDLLEMETQFGDIRLIIIPNDGDEKEFDEMVEAVEYIKQSGGIVQVIQKDSGRLLYEAEIEIAWK